MHFLMGENEKEIDKRALSPFSQAPEEQRAELFLSLWEDKPLFMSLSEGALRGSPSCSPPPGWGEREEGLVLPEA